MPIASLPLMTEVLDYAINSCRIRGIAIWRLGYETNRFWQTVSTKLNR